MTRARHEELAFGATEKVETSRKLAFDGLSFDPAFLPTPDDTPRSSLLQM
jgi:hypothetical protein